MNRNISQTAEWTVKPAAPEEFFRVFPEITPLALQLLWNRNITDPSVVKAFLNPDYDGHVLDPMRFRHMARAVERIIRAAEKKEKITVFGDYDADGVCGAAILHEFFADIGAEHDVFIPDRNREGFGLSLAKMKDFFENGTKLLITVDCGVTDYDEIEYANGAGIDVVILDHHIVPPKWPNAFAIIDHKHPEETYPEHVLSGAGLAFKMVQALAASGAFSYPPGREKWLLDLTAIAAVADMVPLRGENRALVAYGLKVIQRGRRLGLQNIFLLKGKDPRDADIESISHLIAPRINAASRMDHANTAFQLLTTKNETEARWLAERLEEKNEERKKVVEEILANLSEKIEKEKEAPPIIFEGSSEWPAGVLGLAAARLVETYQKPVFLYAINNEFIKGSCRAPRGVNVVELMAGAKDAFSDFGGHTLSGGFSLLPANLSRIRNGLMDAAEAFPASGPTPAYEADAALSIDDVGDSTYEQVRSLEPFGQENPRPVFLFRNVKIADIKKVGAEGNHLKMKLGPRYIGAIYFRALNGRAHRAIARENGFRIGDAIDIMAELQENAWNGSRNIELRIIDARRSE